MLRKIYYIFFFKAYKELEEFMEFMTNLGKDGNSKFSAKGEGEVKNVCDNGDADEITEEETSESTKRGPKVKKVSICDVVHVEGESKTYSVSEGKIVSKIFKARAKMEVEVKTKIIEDDSPEEKLLVSGTVEVLNDGKQNKKKDKGLKVSSSYSYEQEANEPKSGPGEITGEIAALQIHLFDFKHI